jgi:signal transduction histidine kinase
VARVIQSKGFNENRFLLMLEGLGRFNDVVRIAGDRVGGRRSELRLVVEEALKDMEGYPDIEVDYEPAEGEILASEMLKYALINLFKNAAEAMKDSEVKKLFVRLENRSNRMFLVVKDTGCGIVPEYREKIWDSGFTTKEGGHGIGMGVIRKGVESSDGKLLFMNSTPGRGTEFVFAFRLRGNLEGFGMVPAPPAE